MRVENSRTIMNKGLLGLPRSHNLQAVELALGDPNLITKSD
jgi:hypothetical protein